ncbi:MAG: Hsp20/alpha crystallin family protein [Chloroflexi bacterium]|nr:Hsp20/alpha crystallin family protein [Chloroflexota bacterium]
MGSEEHRRGSLVVREREPRRPLAWPEDVERFFERAMRGFGPWPLWRPWRFRRWLRPTLEWVPDIDVFERDGKMVVRADIPGVKRGDVEVTVQGDMLVIHGRREEEKEIKEEDYYRCERATGELSRGISLPEGVDTESIEAVFEDGVLEVTVPKPAAAPKAKKIEVRAK